MCENEPPIRQDFHKLLSDRHTYIQSYRQTCRQTDRTEVIYHAASRVVKNTCDRWEILLFGLFAETWTTGSVRKHDSRMTSLLAAVDHLFRCVYDTLGAVIAVALFLYAVIAFIAAWVVLDAAAAAPTGHGRRRCRQPAVWAPDDGQSLAGTPNAITTTSPRCSTAATVGRTFSETKV